MTAPKSTRTGDGLRHIALFYGDRRQYKAAVLGFIREGLANGEPVLAAVPRNRGRALRDGLGSLARDAAFVDMAALGRNPARIIPFLWSFLDRHPGERIRVVGEPAWPGRTAAEEREVCRHEALVNQAFPEIPAAFLCPYDSKRLATAVLADARRTHPELLAAGRWQPNPNYIGPVVPASCDAPLPAPPPAAESLCYDSGLHRVRELVERHAAGAGLSDDRAADLVIAVSELAANTLRHTAGLGTVHVWRDDGEVVCQVHDNSQLPDPLAGYRPFTHDVADQGLWVVNQLCDLVQIRNGPAGTTVRVRMSLS